MSETTEQLIARLQPLTYLRAVPPGVSMDDFWVVRNGELRAALDEALARLRAFKATVAPAQGTPQETDKVES